MHIVLDMAIQIPSTVEDARYLSIKSLEWAAKIQSQLSVGTVAHAVSSSVWSTETGGGIHQAVAVDHIGCWSDQKYDAKEKKGNQMMDLLCYYMH